MRKKLILISSLLVLGIVSGCGIPQVTFSAFQSTSEAGKLSSVPGETADPAPFNFDKVEFKVTGDMPEGWKVFFRLKTKAKYLKEMNELVQLKYMAIMAMSLDRAGPIIVLLSVLKIFSQALARGNYINWSGTGRRHPRVPGHGLNIMP